MSIYPESTLVNLQVDTHESEVLNEASKAASSINSFRRPRGPDLEDYLQVGRYLHEERQNFPSTKLFGQHLARVAPEVARMNSALRSDAQWLYRAVRGFANGDILEVLGVKDLRDFFSSNPTVIRRAYREAIKAKM